MTDSSISLTCKKHTLHEHWDDVSQWWHDVQERGGNWREANDQEKQMILRWLNNRPLLTDEDQYQWFHDRNSWIGHPPGKIG